MAWGQPKQSLSKSNAAYKRAQSKIKANNKAKIRSKRRKIQSKIKAQMNIIKHLPKGKLSKKTRVIVKTERKKLRATIKKERTTL